MGDERRLRVGGWVKPVDEPARLPPPDWLAPPVAATPSDSISNSATTGEVVTDSALPDPPDPWDRLPDPSTTGSVELGLVTPAGDGYRGRRRVAAGRSDSPRRLMLVVAAVAAVLIGTGALAKALPGEPVTFPAPSPTPPSAPISPSPPPEASRLGPAPSPVVESPAPPPPPPPQSAPPPAAATPSPSETARATPTPMVRSYEAETAELSGFVRIFSMTEASGGAVVGMIGMHRDSYVRFTEVTVAEAGEYELTLHYVSTQGRTGMLSVNGGELITIEFSALSNGNEVGEVRMSVELVAGGNEIWFGNRSGRAPSLDRITVTG